MEDKYEIAKRARQKYVDAVLQSTSKKKIVVAGPGTGKTFLFKKVLEGKSKTLTLTFVNALVEDLALELYGMSDIKTLHSFARGILARRDKEAKLFPFLSMIIAQDARLLLGQDIKFDAIFHNRDDGNRDINFYDARRKYYDRYYGYSDIVFYAVKYLESEVEKIPVYDQVVVDEFQDFNELEVSLIDLLATKSPILVAGDDDQALYDFKNASAKHIRHRHGPPTTDFETFTLPYCSRCTEVLVDATNDLIAAAATQGFLKNRINKSYIYFTDLKKDQDGAKYPKITYAQVFPKQIPWFIDKELGNIASEIKSKFSALIISPTKTQCRGIAEALRNKGFQSVSYNTKREDKEPSLLEGLMILLDDKNSNLGWRIVAKKLLKEAEYSALIKLTNETAAKPINKLIASEYRLKVRDLLKTLRAIKKNKEFAKDHLEAILADTASTPYLLAEDLLRDELVETSFISGGPGIRKIPIKITTIQSSKGLAEDYVFITHFDDQYFVGKGGKEMSDHNICSFLVALTRARKKVFLISSRKLEPTFLQWINPTRIERV